MIKLGNIEHKEIKKMQRKMVFGKTIEGNTNEMEVGFFYFIYFQYYRCR